MSFSSLAFGLGLALLSEPTQTSTAALFGDRPFSVEADRLFADSANELYLAEGDVYFERADMALRADRLWFSKKAERAVAEGNVVLVRGTEVLRCARVEIEFPSLSFDLVFFQLRVMKDASPKALARALEQGLAPDAGRVIAVLEGEKAERPADRELTMRDVRFTPCDCAAGDSPSWSIRASEASVDLDGGAWLTAPVFYVKELPVLVLPFMYVPLGDRRPGLLTPRFGYDPITGFRVRQPLFLTLGRSYDLTFTGTYYTRRGFAAATEVRWAPSSQSAGEVELDLLFDDGAYDEVEGGFSRSRPEALARFSLRGRHDSRFRRGRLAMDLDLVGDPQWKAELAPSFLERQVEESVSRLSYAESFDEHVRLGVGLALRQDLRPSRYESSGVERREISLFSAALPGPGSVRYRLLELRLDAAPTPLARALPGLVGEARLSVQAFGAASPEVPRFMRADFRPELSWSFAPFGLFVLVPSVALRTTAWSGQNNSENLSRGRVAARLETELFTELSRDFGSFSHRLRPSVRHLFLPLLARPQIDAFFAADEIDLLADVHQLAGALESDIFASGRRVFGVSALLGSDMGLGSYAGQGLSPLILNATLELHDLLPESSLRLGARAGIDLEHGKLEQLVGSLSLVSSTWLSMSLLFGELGRSVPRSGFIAPEELVPSNTISRARYLTPAQLAANMLEAADALLFTPYRGLTGGLTVRPIEALSVGASASLDFSFDDDLDLEENANAQRTNSPLRNVGGYLRYDSPCECWGALVQLGWARDRPGPDVRVLLDLAQLGR